MNERQDGTEWMVEVLNDIMTDHKLCWMQERELKKAIEIIKGHIPCTECKFYYAPVCTFHKELNMVSRHGFCYHAVRGKYEGDIPKVEVKNEHSQGELERR